MADAEQERELVRRRLLGWSLAAEPIFPGVDLGRDLKFVRGSGGLDLARVSAMDNLGQALSIALTTLVGSDPFNTGFGFRGLSVLAEELNPILAREKIRVAVIDVLRQDPRVRRILDVKLDNGPLEAPVAGSRELSIRVEFETVSADRAAVELGKVAPGV